MKIKICSEPGCKNAETTKGYCRLHYLKNWKTIRTAAQKKSADRLNKYVEGICKKFPEKYLDVIRQNIQDGKSADGKTGDEDAPEDLSEEVLQAFGYQDDESLDKLLSHIKIDKDF